MCQLRVDHPGRERWGVTVVSNISRSLGFDHQRFDKMGDSGSDSKELKETVGKSESLSDAEGCTKFSVPVHIAID